MQDGHQDSGDIRQNDTTSTEAVLNGNQNTTHTSEDTSALQDTSATSSPISNGAGDAPETAPRGKKRKLAEIAALNRSRALSPPWKKFEAEGPTSFTEDGRRKSGRTNALPMELQPPSNTRKTRAAQQKTTTGKGKSTVTAQQSTSKASKTSDRVKVKPEPAGKGAVKNHKEPEQGESKAKRARIILQEEKGSELVKEEVSSKTPRRKYTKRQFPPSDRSSRRKRESPGTVSAADPSVSEQKPTQSIKSESPTATFKPIKSLRINFRPPPLPVLNPSNLLPKRKYPALKDFLAQDDPLEGEEEVAFTEVEARREADVIQIIEDAARSGEYFKGDAWLDATSDPQEEPEIPYTHPDYLLKHVIDFQPRLEREKALHMATAKRVAHLALAEWRRRQPKTEEEILEEQRRLFTTLYKKALKEMDNKWGEVIIYVKRQKLQQYEEEQQRLGKKALNDMLDYSSQLMKERKRSRTDIGELGEVEEDDDEDAEDDDNDSGGSASGDVSSGSSDDDDDDEDEESDGESSSDEGSQVAQVMSDDELTAEELRQKYSSVPELELTTGHESDDPAKDSFDGDTTAGGSTLAQILDTSDDHDAMKLDAAHAEEDVIQSVQIDPSQVQMDEVDDALLDDEDESDDDDDADDDDDSDEDDDDSDNEDEDDDAMSADADEDEDEQPGLMGFFSKKQVNAIKKESDTLATDEEPVPAEPSLEHAAPEGDVQETDLQETEGVQPSVKPAPSLASPGLPDSAEHDTATDTPITDEPSRQMSPATTKPSEADSATSTELDDNALVPHDADGARPVANRIEVPLLLRGTLREYQHNGLDWLAGMHRSKTNGILADEMGLGKTIQTISLLAHLATNEHIWGPHLVIVPTSVMLNWEMEFKKFLPGFKILTYYGTQEERKRKRMGWNNDDKWNVCITSYQLALQDAGALKRKNWHYMVLDEAHNIKNFQSKRWQTLLNFKSEARLLLTGTPLQNNLTELWSLLFFLKPGETEQGGVKFADLATFNKVFHRPVDQIMEHGREALDEEAKESVAKLHRVLRPHLLRRLKADVEKQMPKKYEHIVKCRLSKRQRQLYDGYMGLAGTRESFQSGNYMSIINCLMQLRKVCNHPDLFETRQIVTSYAMPKSAVADYELKELLVRKRWLEDEDHVDGKISLLRLWEPNVPSLASKRAGLLAALAPLSAQAQKLELRVANQTGASGRTTSEGLSTLNNTKRQGILAQINDSIQRTSTRTRRGPVYSGTLLRKLSLGTTPLRPVKAAVTDLNTGLLLEPCLETSSVLREMIITLPERGETMETAIEKFGCVTPAVVAPKMTRLALTEAGMRLVTEVQEFLPGDAFHEARTRLSIAFPDKSLIQYDCGKLQALDRLLRDLQARGSRALIFTQMTKVLDILEQFLNLHGHRYLRLDGSTKIEQRQVLTDRFNNDTRILAFILSSRSGGLGINLTGADTVIFYDLDWNPAMDKQCQDRCHRIGQTRDVHIYRFISEGTIEANILRKSNQKRMLDDVVIQEGDFTTEYFNRFDPRDFLDNDVEADAAVDRVFGGSEAQADKVLEQAEDKEDRDAAKEAQKEYVHMDDEDFDEKAGTSSGQTPKSEEPSTPATPDAEMQYAQQSTPQVEEEEEPGSYEEYMLRFVEWELKDVVIKPPSERSRKRAKKGKDYVRIRR